MTLKKILIAGTALSVALMVSPAFAAKASNQSEIEALKEQVRLLSQKLDQLQQNQQDMQENTSDQLTQLRGDGSVVTVKGGHPVFKTRDGAFEASFGGRLQADAYAIDSRKSAPTPQIGRSRIGTEIRRARMNMAGKLFTTWRWKFEVDFANNAVAIKDAYVQTDLFPGAMITVGNMYEPFGLDNVTSDNYNNFMEFSLPVKMRTDRTLGVMLSYADQRMWGVQAGLFSDNKVSKPAANDTTDWSATGRVWFAPIYDPVNNIALHIAADGRYMQYEGGNTVGGASSGITAIPEADGAATTLDTSAITGISHDIRYGPEIAFNYGPFEVQGEYTWMNISRNVGRDIRLTGGYAEASWFVTGESRNYDITTGLFGRPKIDPDGGAIQLAARYSTMDIGDAFGKVTSNTKIGKENDITLGVNYYFNPNIRLMLNYVNADVNYRTTKDENDNILETRIQVDW